jgi:2'-5' RNA ligase
MTLHHLGDYPELPESLIEAASADCQDAVRDQASFEITLDHVKSFRGRPGHAPFVLMNPAGSSALSQLHQRLAKETSGRLSAGRHEPHFVPHVTLLYDGQNVPEQPVSPISWREDKMVLVLSHLGKTKYEHLNFWSLH